MATVVSGAPFSLRVSDSTSLCTLAKDAQLVPLCSAFATGPNLALELDDGPARAWELQFREQFAPEPTQPAEPSRDGQPLSAWANFSTIDEKGKRAYGGKDVAPWSNA